MLAANIIKHIMAAEDVTLILSIKSAHAAGLPSKRR